MKLVTKRNLLIVAGSIIVCLILGDVSMGIPDQKYEDLTYSLTLGVDKHFAQAFFPTYNELLRVEIYLLKQNSPTEGITMYFCDNTSGKPDLNHKVGNELHIPEASLTSGDWNEFDFTDFSLTPDSDQCYWICINSSGQDATNSWIWKFGYPNDGYINGQYAFSLDNGSSWTTGGGYDMAYRTYGATLLGISDIYPANGSADIPINVTLHFTVTSTPGYNMNITVYTGSNMSNCSALLGSFNSVGNGTYYIGYHNASEVSTGYAWKVNVSDGMGNYVQEVYRFTTKSADASLITTGLSNQFNYLPLLAFIIVPFIFLLNKKRKKGIKEEDEGKNIM